MAAAEEGSWALRDPFVRDRHERQQARRQTDAEAAGGDHSKNPTHSSPSQSSGFTDDLTRFAQRDPFVRDRYERQQARRQTDAEAAGGDHSKNPTHSSSSQSSGFTDDLTRFAQRSLRGASATVGDILTGVAEIPYTAAQMGLAGVDALSPQGSALESGVKDARDWVDQAQRGVGSYYDQIFGGGETYGREIGQMLGTAPLGALKVLNPATFKGAMGLGGVSGMLSQPTTAEDPSDFFSQKAGQATTGAAFGFGARTLEPVLGRVLKPFSTKTDSVSQHGFAAADRLGVPLSAGQKTGHKNLELLESTMKRMPGASGHFREFNAAQEQAVNRAALKAMGQEGRSAEVIDPAHLGAIRRDVGEQIGAINARGFVRREDLARLKGPMETIKSANEAMQGHAIPEVRRIVDQFESLIAGNAPDQIPGGTVQNILTKINHELDALSENKLGYGAIKHALSQSKRALTEAFTLTPVDRTARETLNRQYATAKTLGDPGVLKEGQINPTQLERALRRKYGRNVAEGPLGGPLADIAQVGRTFRDQIPDSGTATRQMAIDMVTGNPFRWGQSAVAGPMAKAYLSAPMQRYLTEGIGPDLSWLTRILPYMAGPYSANRIGAEPQ